MILGDSLQVMASLAEREGLRGKVQCIYFDPPYGIKFNSNFQWSTTSRDVKDGNADHITREPEQVKAFRDTWRDGIHSYLTYLRDRLTVARDLLTDSGSIFVQIGDENVHRSVRSWMKYSEKPTSRRSRFKKPRARAQGFSAERTTTFFGMVVTLSERSTARCICQSSLVNPAQRNTSESRPLKAIIAQQMQVKSRIIESFQRVTGCLQPTASSLPVNRLTLQRFSRMFPKLAQ
jgi:hypothetical protein